MLFSAPISSLRIVVSTKDKDRLTKSETCGIPSTCRFDLSFHSICSKAQSARSNHWYRHHRTKYTLLSSFNALYISKIVSVAAAVEDLEKISKHDEPNQYQSNSIHRESYFARSDSQLSVLVQHLKASSHSCHPEVPATSRLYLLTDRLQPEPPLPLS
ncbi:hypothetical protein I308_106060 [Cryptococcus tetragattii IND107]|uniref:Uncharacterized protein n=1 Tax=Cryptococcus tetragattii IND107 TaxID=1296105 RepID=A0ABR3BMS2_9TREE